MYVHAYICMYVHCTLHTVHVHVHAYVHNRAVEASGLSRPRLRAALVPVDARGADSDPVHAPTQSTCCMVQGTWCGFEPGPRTQDHLRSAVHECARIDGVGPTMDCRHLT